MADITHIFNGPFSFEDGPKETPEQQLRNEMARHGINPPESIYFDGVLHRFNTGDGKKDKSGWYAVHGDGIPAGAFGCFRAGVENTWRADVGHELTPEEHAAINARLEDAKRSREEERQRTRESAADAANAIWVNAPSASPDHPYLKRKGIQPHGARIMSDGRLAVPLYDEFGKLSSLQYISGDGEKRYHTGGATGGKFWMVGNHDKQGPIYIAEGFATAATIYEQTGCACIVAYSASNLVNVTGSVRDIYGVAQELIIVADNDDSKVGQNYAEQASAKHGADVIVMPHAGDANDYHQAGNDLKSLLTIEDDDDWLVNMLDWAQQDVDIKWLVKGYIRKDALMRVFGPSGHGKTFVVLDWAMTIATGKDDWNGHKVKRGSVAYLAGEGHAGIKSRVLAWVQENGVDDKTVINISKSGCSLNTPDGYTKARRSIAKMGECDLVIIDTQHAFYEGEENSAKDAKTMIDACKALIEEFKCSVLLVHHTGVSEDAAGRARGSGSFKGAMDIELNIHRIKGQSDRLTIRYSKAKDTEEMPPVFMDFRTVILDGRFDEDGEPVKSAVMDFVKDGEEQQEKFEPLPDYLEDRKIIEDAWLNSGRELLQGMPYITRSALRDYMLKTSGLSPTTIDNKLKPSRKYGIINGLIENGEISEAASGYIINGLITASIMKMVKTLMDKRL